MTITICGSMQFYKEMLSTKKALETMGFRVIIPKEADNIAINETFMTSDEARIAAKIEYDFIRAHFRVIEQADAVLILNYEKRGVPGYIGGNTFLEMGYAFGLGKKVYLLNPVPEMDYKTEMHAIQPIVLHGDLEKITA